MNSRQLARNWPFGRYKHYQKKMQKAATDWFVSKQFLVNARLHYMLASREQWSQNIILPEVVAYIQNQIVQRPGFPLHKYIHHGLSSQAMLFNLIAPLIVRNDLEILLGLLPGHGDSQTISAQFEYENRTIFNEDSGQPTSIDLLLQNVDRPLYCIESKFTEAEFGGCSIFRHGDCDGRNPAHDFDQCYLHFIGRHYWDLMRKHGFITPQLQQDHFCIFSTYYQFFREVLFALEAGGVFVLLYDDRNPAFYNEADGIQRGLFPLLRSFVPEQHQHHVHGITLQQVVKAIKQTNRHGWITEFEKKYGVV